MISFLSFCQQKTWICFGEEPVVPKVPSQHTASSTVLQLSPAPRALLPRLLHFLIVNSTVSHQIEVTSPGKGAISVFPRRMLSERYLLLSPLWFIWFFRPQVSSHLCPQSHCMEARNFPWFLSPNTVCYSFPTKASLLPVSPLLHPSLSYPAVLLQAFSFSLVHCYLSP